VVPLDGRIKQVDVLLDDLGDGRHTLLIRQDGMLRNLEGLAVGVQEPL
jgi:hypothetical protein